MLKFVMMDGSVQKGCNAKICNDGWVCPKRVYAKICNDGWVCPKRMYPKF
jgi:hypothetical protein